MHETITSTPDAAHRRYVLKLSTVRHAACARL